MQTKRQLAVLVLACSIVLFSQGARCSNFSLNITLTSNSPLNCSTVLTYPGPAFVRVEYLMAIVTLISLTSKSMHYLDIILVYKIQRTQL